MPVEKTPEFSRKWAVVTLHPWLPSKSEQIARARAWGVVADWFDGIDISSLFLDDVRKVGRTTNWPSKLPNREIFIRSMQAFDPKAVGDTVFFATPLCVGFSEKHARQTVEDLWKAGLMVYVHSTGALYREGDDLTEFLEKVGQDAKAAHMRDYRKRKS